MIKPFWVVLHFMRASNKFQTEPSFQAQDKPATVRISSLLTSRHLSQRRVKFPIRKYKNEGSKVNNCSFVCYDEDITNISFVCLNYTVLLQVPFFSDDEDTPTTPKADALFIPRENPRALIICPMEQWPGRTSEKASSFKDRYASVNENGTVFMIEYIQCLFFSFEINYSVAYV